LIFLQFQYIFILYYFISSTFTFLKNISNENEELYNQKYSITKYSNNNFFVTSKYNGYDKKYYIQGNYLHSIIENNHTCLNSCLLWVNSKISPNSFAVTGFDISYINEDKCECKGQILEKKTKIVL
jgi:hypothetical protein